MQTKLIICAPINHMYSISISTASPSAKGPTKPSLKKLARVSIQCLWAEPQLGSLLCYQASVSEPHQERVKTAVFLGPLRLRRYSLSLGKERPQTHLPVLSRQARVINRAMVWWNGQTDRRGAHPQGETKPHSIH